MYFTNWFAIEKELEYRQQEIERSVMRKWNWKPETAKAPAKAQNVRHRAR